MKRRAVTAALTTGCLAATAVLALSLGPSPSARAAKKPRQVLFFTKSSGFEHSVIKLKEGGAPSHATTVLQELAGKHGFEVTASKDGSVFTPEGLAKYDVLVFFTTGDLTQAGNDRNPPFPPGGKEALLEAVKKGKGFIGLHAASDTFHSPGDRFVNDGEATDPFIQMLGGEFIKHGAQMSAKVFCSDTKFPGLADCPKDGFDLHEEWYSLKNIQKDLHVLQWIATWSMKNTGNDSVYRRAPFPVTWARMHGKGRVFYTALGHREDVWTNPSFQNMLVGAIKWAAGDARANVKPNITQVTPYYDQLPPNDPPPPKKETTAAAPAGPAAKPRAN